jgi:hypothetical protein
MRDWGGMYPHIYYMHVVYTSLGFLTDWTRPPAPNELIAKPGPGPGACVPPGDLKRQKKSVIIKDSKLLLFFIFIFIFIFIYFG